MLSCRQATELVSKGLDTQLSIPERLGLKLHVGMCRHCSRYRRQLLQMREVLQRGMDELPELAALRSFTLQPDERTRLAQAVAAESST